jgi:F420-non-reducing hydrogenase iron-sulfur subunit
MTTPDVLFYVCANCVPEVRDVPRQWTQGNVKVKVQQLPCTGKLDLQYVMHAIEGGAQGVSVVGCPKGECHLAQGNYRAEVRVKTAQRLLVEVGMAEDMVSLLDYKADDANISLGKMMRDEVERLSQNGKSPLHLKISAN